MEPDPPRHPHRPFTSGILCSHIHQALRSGRGGCRGPAGGSSSGIGGRSWAEGKIPNRTPPSRASPRCGVLNASPDAWRRTRSRRRSCSVSLGYIWFVANVHILVQLYWQYFLQPPPPSPGVVFTRPRPSPGPPVAHLLLGSVPAGSFLQAAYEEGERHGQDDDAAHHRSQHGHSEAAVLGPGDRCGAKVKS